MSMTNGGLNRRRFLQKGIAAGALPSLGALLSAQPAVAALPAATGSGDGADDRRYWVDTLAKVSEPVLRAMSQRRLKAEMPVEAPHGNERDRAQYTHLEAIGRLLSGIAPWLESGAQSGAEGELRARYAELARQSMDAATDPASPDFVNFNKGGQPVVDTAFLALAILRAPNELWKKLDAKTQRNLVAALESSRVIRPSYSNWLLFSATVEATLARLGRWWDPMRIDYAIRSLDSWYKGDGAYGDGPSFHWDYYNSFVMHPMLLNILDALQGISTAWDKYKPVMLERSVRYAAVQERLIAPDASFPPIGRSLAYRFGAFHLLAEMALRRQLPEGVQPAQVRSALTAVMRRQIEAPGTFDAKGWLTIGFYGHQPSIAESYISTGSSYLCSAAWLPLGLPAADPFWSGPSQSWTSKKVWNGEEVKPDHAGADHASA